MLSSPPASPPWSFPGWVLGLKGLNQSHERVGGGKQPQRSAAQAVGQAGTWRSGHLPLLRAHVVPQQHLSRSTDRTPWRQGGHPTVQPPPHPPRHHTPPPTHPHAGSHPQHQREARTDSQLRLHLGAMRMAALSSAIRAGWRKSCRRAGRAVPSRLRSFPTVAFRTPHCVPSLCPALCIPPRAPHRPVDVGSVGLGAGGISDGLGPANTCSTLQPGGPAALGLFSNFSLPSCSERCSFPVM